MKSMALASGLALALGVLFSGAARAGAAEKKPRLLRHVVAFKYKEDASDKKIADIEKAFAGLKKTIHQIKAFEKGVNNSPEGLNKGFKHCYLITFESEKGRDDYLKHPEHLKFVDLVRPVLEDVFVIDYWAEK